MPFDEFRQDIIDQLAGQAEHGGLPNMGTAEDLERAIWRAYRGEDD